MLKLEEAREIQASRQKKALLKFGIALGMILVVNWIADALFLHFKLDNRLIPLLGFLSLLLGYLFVKTEMPSFFQKKEYNGIVIRTEADAEPTKTSASHLPGERYKTVDCPVLTIVVEEAGTGKTRIKKCNLHRYLSEIRDGDEIAVLRFIDQPVLLSALQREENLFRIISECLPDGA